MGGITARMAPAGEAIDKALELAVQSVRDISAKLFGPWADEIALSFADSARVWRFRRAVSLLEKVKKIAADAGFEPQAVKPHLLLPILEGASLQGDEDLHTRWANLLANAAHPQIAENVLPSFPEVLRQLSPDEAQFLDNLFEEAEEPKHAPGAAMGSLGNIRDVILVGTDNRAESVPATRWDRFELIAADLVRLGMLHLATIGPTPSYQFVPVTPYGVSIQYKFTQFGRAFVQTCRAPQRLHEDQPTHSV